MLDLALHGSIGAGLWAIRYPNMSNNFFSENSRHPNQKSKNMRAKRMNAPDASNASFPEKTANWPDVPGKKGPNRSAGVKKAKVYAQSKGV